ncbi:nuclear cap-binding protein subunit 1-like [Elysia marginata]|uniref:Nuclear cap-binding protein subunit 1-like n=1 Tax=Elysia marginata TaxID=1093978 RepID=A0AAV4FEW5_9GAST|nr:nuclear cap-binding protein subunit 1-like [Elysia marginata]
MKADPVASYHKLNCTSPHQKRRCDTENNQKNRGHSRPLKQIYKAAPTTRRLRFHPNLKSLAEFDDGKVCLLKVLYEVWKTNQQMMVVLVDKLLRTEVVDCSSVANWLFSFEMQHDFTSFYVWEIMHSTIKKMSRHVDQLQQEVDNAHDKQEAAKRKEQDGLDVIDDDVPTDEAIERMEERLESATSAQKNLFLVIFQRFIIVLTEHLARCESAGVDYNTPWYKWVIERLQQVFLMVFTNHRHMTGLCPPFTLHASLFTPLPPSLPKPKRANIAW